MSETRGEAFRMGDAALEATECTCGLHLLDDVDTIVVAQPGELALVCFEHRCFRFDHVGDVDEFSWCEAEPREGFHEEDRRHLVVMWLPCLRERQCCMEAAIENDLGNLVRVGDVIV